MTPKECAEYLAKYNQWRRGDHEDNRESEMPNPRELGLVIDRAIELLSQDDDIGTLEQEIRQVRARLDRVQKEQAQVIEAAKAVIARWHSPNWKDTKHTADYIQALDAAIRGAS